MMRWITKYLRIISASNTWVEVSLGFLEIGLLHAYLQLARTLFHLPLCANDILGTLPYNASIQNL